MISSSGRAHRAIVAVSAAARSFSAARRLAWGPSASSVTCRAIGEMLGLDQVFSDELPTFGELLNEMFLRCILRQIE